MKKLAILLFVFCLIFVGCGETENITEENDEKTQQIDNEQVLSNYSKLKKVNADYLFENAEDYKEKNVMSVAIVGDIEGKTLKLKTDKNKDALFFSFTAECNNESELQKLNIDERVCFVAKVGEKFSVGGCVDLSNCEIVASGANVSKYESQLKSGKTKKSGESSKKKENKKSEKQQYIESCKTYSYTKIKRNPDKYEGKKIKLSGKVVQIDEGWFDSVTMRVEDSNGDDWYVSYSYSDKENKILEDDRITIYGECDGTEQYTTIVGDTRRIPSIDAKYIK